MALKQGKSIPLQEDIDPDYEPSAEGIKPDTQLQKIAQLVPQSATDTQTLLTTAQKLLTTLSGLALIWNPRRSSCGSVERASKPNCQLTGRHCKALSVQVCLATS